MKIYLDDDIRVFEGKPARPTPKGWIRVYTYEEAIDGLQTGKVEEISLDNDLGTDLEGYDVLKWIEKMTFETHFRPPKIHIHSANIVAREKMEYGREAIEWEAKQKGTYRK
jgi:hypothetical protein